MKKHTDKFYFSPAVTVDVVILTIDQGELKVLLIRRARPPFEGVWALPGGFLFQNETTEKGALRVLADKTGVKNAYIEQLYTFDSSGRDPRGPAVSVSYFALMPREKLVFESAKDLQAPTLLPVNKLPPLAFDHKRIVNYALRRLRSKLEYTNAVFSLLPKKFTLGQLQATYEAIWGKKLDKRNFRKKFVALGLIKPTSQKLGGAQHRPAQLYVFVEQRPIELKRFF